MKITLDQAIVAYSASKDVYEAKMLRREGVEQIKKVGMNAGSASIYLNVYQSLVRGQAFSRTLNAQSFDYFLEQILKDSGKLALFTALKALKAHVDYFEGIQNTQMHSVRRIYKKHSLIYVRSIQNTIDKDDDDELAFPEGKEVYRLHVSKERNSEVVRLAKEKLLANDALLSCQVCSFSFRSVFGELGKGYIEAHHVFPVSELKAETKTKVEDLALVCLNCHRMLHRRRPWLSIEQLKKVKENPQKWFALSMSRRCACAPAYQQHEAQNFLF